MLRIEHFRRDGAGTVIAVVELWYRPSVDLMFVFARMNGSIKNQYTFTPTTTDVATLAGCVQANQIGVMLDYLQERVTDQHGQEVIAKAMEFACW